MDYYYFFNMLREIDAEINDLIFIEHKTKALQSKDTYKPKIKLFEIDKRKRIHNIRNCC